MTQMDRISKEHRSWNMSRIRSRNTKPEKMVRSLLHRMGYRFTLHRKDLPGKPDIVYQSTKQSFLSTVVSGTVMKAANTPIFQKQNRKFLGNQIQI